MKAIKLTRGVSTAAEFSAALDGLGVKAGDDYAVCLPEKSEPVRARTTDPSTSHRAAADVAPRAGTHYDAIMRALAEVFPKGLDSHQIDQATGREESHKRIPELVADGRIYRMAEHVGKKASAMNVYALTAKGCLQMGIAPPITPPEEPEREPDSLLDEPQQFSPAGGAPRSAIFDID